MVPMDVSYGRGKNVNTYFSGKYGHEIIGMFV